MENTGKNAERLIVTVSDDGLSNIDHIASKLTEKGLIVDEVMPMTGIITGSYSSDEMQDLQDVDGVLNVEKEQIITLPPADSTLQ